MPLCCLGTACSESQDLHVLSFPQVTYSLGKKHFSAAPHCPPRREHPRPEASPVPPFSIWENVLLGSFFRPVQMNGLVGFFFLVLFSEDLLWCKFTYYISSGVQCHDLMSVYIVK